MYLTLVITPSYFGNTVYMYSRNFNYLGFYPVTDKIIPIRFNRFTHYKIQKIKNKIIDSLGDARKLEFIEHSTLPDDFLLD